MGPSMPAWFWIIFYAFLIISWGTSIYFLFRGEVQRLLSLLNVLVVPLFLVLVFVTSLNRADVTEAQYFMESIESGKLWSIFSLLLLIYIVYYWIHLLYKGRRKKVSNRNHQKYS
jgi:hypothetical protein